jgi:oligopeptide transport system substrate-binding protein
MYRTLIGLLATLGAALLLAGLSFSASIGKPANVRFVNYTEPDTLDPHVLTGQTGGRIVTALFEGLTRHDAKSLAAAPGMAESWEISEDGLRYTFHLRTGSQWSDGVGISAADFVYSFRRMLDPKLGAAYAYLLHPLKGGKAFNTFEALADRIDAKLLPALAKEIEAAPAAGLSAPAWSSLLARLPVQDSLQNSQDPEARSLLDSAPQLVSIERLQQLVRTLGSEAQRMRDVARDVRGRFGTSLGVYALDPHTLVIELDAPAPYFLDITSFYSTLPVPRHVVEKHGGAWFLPENIVSNGPFVLESWRVNDRIRLRKNERYWGKSEVRADAIDVLPTENPTTALNLFLTGDADWLPAPAYPTDLVEQLMQRPDFYVHAAFNVYFYRLNTRRPPLNDARVRQALNLAIDRELIVKRVLGRGELPATRLVPPGVPGFEPLPTRIGLDVERARQLLAEAGFPGGKGFPALGILYNTLDSHKKVAEVIADQLARNLGIEVTPYNQEWQSYLATTRAGNFDIARAGWIGDYLDPNTFLDLWVSNGGNNETGFSSPSYDSLIRAAADMEQFARQPAALLSLLKQPEAVSELLRRRSESPDTRDRRLLLDAARMRLLGEAEGILVQDEFPILPIYFYVNSGLRAPGLRGLYTELELPDGQHVPNLQDIHPLRDLWFDATQR